MNKLTQYWRRGWQEKTQILVTAGGILTVLVIGIAAAGSQPPTAPSASVLTPVPTTTVPIFATTVTPPPTPTFTTSSPTPTPMTTSTHHRNTPPPVHYSPKPSPSPTVPPLHQVSDPGQVTGTLTGPCHTRDNGQLPDPACTPGAYDPNITVADLCPRASTSAYRPPESQTNNFKWNVAEPAYGQVSVSGELDHLVPLELGGANDASNLWVEAGSIPNPKDAVENRLHDEVCAGTISLSAAQRDIATNWMTAP